MYCLSRERELLGLWLVISPSRFSNDTKTISRRRLMCGAYTVHFAVHQGNCPFYTDSVFSPCPPTRPLLRRIDLILILWPIFFVAATRQEPHLKPREFKRSAETVAKAVRLKRVTTSLQGPLKRTMGDKGGRQIDDEATERQIQQPYWETTPPNTHVVDQLVSGLGR